MARRLRKNHAKSVESVELHDESVAILHVNVQGLLFRFDELVEYVMLMKKGPSIFVLE